MKEIVKMSRLTGALEKLFRMLNADFYGSTLDLPIITVQSTPKAYGHFTPYQAWDVKGDGKPEINLGAGTLDRPIEYVCATMLHEMAHYYNYSVLKQADCSRGGQYHNGVFKATAESHGLVCHRNKYGWSDTNSELSDALLDWVLTHDVPEIKLNRVEALMMGTTTKAADKNPAPPASKPKGNSFLWICPICGDKMRSSKPEVFPMCGRPTHEPIAMQRG